MNRRNFLKLAGSSALLSYLNGCDILTNLEKNPKGKPTFDFYKKYDNFDWEDYLDQLEEYYDIIQKSKKNLNDAALKKINKEVIKKTKPLLDYSQHLSQIKFNPKNLILISSNSRTYPRNIIQGLIEGNQKSAIAGYFNNRIFLDLENINLSTVLHEFGHHTDKKLNYVDWAFSKFAQSRAEAVAESFIVYFSNEIKEIHPKKSKELFNSSVISSLTINEKFEDLKTGSPYSNANVILAAYYIKFNHDIKKTWSYVKNTPSKKMYSELEEICKNRDIKELVSENHKILSRLIK